MHQELFTIAFFKFLNCPKSKCLFYNIFGSMQR